MTAIASPQPRRASRKHNAPSAIQPLSPPLYLSTDLPPVRFNGCESPPLSDFPGLQRIPSSGITSPPRLLSPIHLGDPVNYVSPTLRHHVFSHSKDAFSYPNSPQLVALRGAEVMPAHLFAQLAVGTPIVQTAP